MNISEPPRPWITATEAARRADVTRDCIARWARRYGIGRKVAGRLRIEPAALERLLAGEQAGGQRDAA